MFDEEVHKVCVNSVGRFCSPTENTARFKRSNSNTTKNIPGIFLKKSHTQLQDVKKATYLFFENKTLFSRAVSNHLHALLIYNLYPKLD